MTQPVVPAETSPRLGAQKSTLLQAVYSSVAATTVGCLLGRLFESLPFRIGGVKLSYWLFCLPASPIAAAAYLLLKLFGCRFELRTDELAEVQIVSQAIRRSVPLDQIATVEIEHRPCYAFYSACDLHLIGTGGERLLSLPAIGRGEVFRQTILQACLARRSVSAALQQIERRHVTAAPPVAPVAPV